MKPGSSKSAGGLGGTVRGEVVELCSDSRLARRWKRRSIAYGNFGVSAHKDEGLKKTIHHRNGTKDAPVEVVIIDSDDEQLLDVVELRDDFDVSVAVDCADGNDFSDDFDPHYMMFLANLKEDGKSYLLELALSMETPLVLKYEKEDDDSNIEKTKSDFIDDDYSEFLKSVKEGLYLECTPEGGGKFIYEESDCDSEAGKKAEDHVSSENGRSSKSQSLEATSSAKHQFHHRVKSDLDYQEFLKFVTDGQHLEYAPEGGKKITYEESDTDSEIMILDDNPFYDGKPTPEVVIDLDGEECIENHSQSKESVFRSELMEILRKPYDKKEYEKLWQDASHQLPLQGVRILRGRDKPYNLDSYGKSYIEVHSDLGLVINQAQPDKRRILNILRGFFYWLQNLAHEGSFRPWLDSSCLRVVPPIPPKPFRSR